MMKQLNMNEAYTLVSIGFCQPKFYKRSIWLKAKKIMDDVACKFNLAYPHDFGRGLGKYSTDLDLDEAKKVILDKMVGLGMINRFPKSYVVTKLNNRYAYEIAGEREFTDSVSDIKCSLKTRNSDYDEITVNLRVFSQAPSVNTAEYEVVDINDFIANSSFSDFKFNI